MSWRDRLYYRAKSFVERENFRKLLERNALPQDGDNQWSAELIEMMETVRNFRKDANVLLDIGSHKGLFSKTANAFFSFDHTVCFEPNHSLNDEIRRNNAGVDLTIENVALSSGEGEVDFFLHQDSTMNSIVESDDGVLRSEFPWDNPALMTKTTVRTRTLDNWVGEKSFPKPVFFIKLDTQGNELNVLRHGLNALRMTELCLIEFMFTTPYKTDFEFYELVEFMHSNAFDCKGALSLKKRPSGRISAVDFLFVKRT